MHICECVFACDCQFYTLRRNFYRTYPPFPIVLVENLLQYLARSTFMAYLPPGILSQYSSKLRENCHCSMASELYHTKPKISVQFDECISWCLSTKAISCKIWTALNWITSISFQLKVIIWHISGQVVTWNMFTEFPKIEYSISARNIHLVHPFSGVLLKNLHVFF